MKNFLSVFVLQQASRRANSRPVEPIEKRGCMAPRTIAHHDGTNPSARIQAHFPVKAGLGAREKALWQLADDIRERI
jgi:hypothetical protein